MRQPSQEFNPVQREDVRRYEPGDVAPAWRPGDLVLTHGSAWTSWLTSPSPLLTGARLTFGIAGQEICSGLAARCMERTGAVFNRPVSHIMPADVAKYYGAEPPVSPPMRHARGHVASSG